MNTPGYMASQIHKEDGLHKGNGYDPGEFTEMLLTKLRYNSTEEEIDALMLWNLEK